MFISIRLTVQTDIKHLVENARTNKKSPCVALAQIGVFPRWRKADILLQQQLIRGRIHRTSFFVQESHGRFALQTAASKREDVVTLVWGWLWRINKQVSFTVKKKKRTGSITPLMMHMRKSALEEHQHLLYHVYIFMASIAYAKARNLTHFIIYHLIVN